MRQIVAFACNQHPHLVICGSVYARTTVKSLSNYVLPKKSVRRFSLPELPSMPKASPASEALNWLSRILAIGLVMLGCGWLGGQVDRFFNTQLFTAVGFLVGMTIGLAALIGILKRSNDKSQPQ